MRLSYFFMFVLIGASAFVLTLEVQAGQEASGVPAFLFVLSTIPWLAVRQFKQRAADLEAQFIKENVINRSSLPGGKKSELTNEAPEIICLNPTFFLYLRPFSSTNSMTVSASDVSGRIITVREFEDELANAARPFAPLIGAGKSLEHIGVGRVEMMEGDWMATIRVLMENANLIILIPAVNPGTWWEINQLLTNKWIEKVIVVNPRDSILNFRSQQKEAWEKFQALLAEHGYNLPNFRRSGRLIFFGASNRPAIDMTLKLEARHLRQCLLRAQRLLPVDVWAKGRMR
jgi:hypothetical protein